MESTSDDSFLWTDASNESTYMDIETVALDHEGEWASLASFKHGVRQSPLEMHYDSGNERSSKKRSKKRRVSENTNISQYDKKQIKLELESDTEASNMKKLRKNIVYSNTPQDSISNDDHYLNTIVKQEQESLMEPQVIESKKKDIHRRSISDTKNSNHSQSSVDLDEKNTENYLDMKVKQEQESFVIPEVEKSKRKKKHKSLNFDVENDSQSQVVEEPNSSETESYLDERVKQEQASVLKSDMKSKKKKKHNTSRASSVTEQSESQISQSDSIENNHSVGAEQTNMEYSVIESKFSAEETVINKLKKKRQKTHNEFTGSTVIDKSSIDRKRESIAVVSKEYSDENSNNDISVQTYDFNCKNIVSSTIINNSTIDIINNKNKQVNVTKDLLVNEEKIHTTTKISDRIRFEEDESSSYQDLNLKTQTSKVVGFLKINPHLQLFSPKTQYNSVITEDDEIWIIKCPREIKQDELKNGNLSLGGKCKLKINGQTYDGIPNEDINRITHVAYRNGQTAIMNFPVKGCVHYRKRIPKARVPENITMVNNQTNFIPLPETKCRHPLFGANYKKAIKIPAVIAERLEAAKDRHNETVGSSKKKKHKKDKKKSTDVKMNEDCKIEFEPPAKKNRKRKRAEDIDAPPNKTKRLKHDPHSAEVWESEQAIEENLFNF